MAKGFGDASGIDAPPTPLPQDGLSLTDRRGPWSGIGAEPMAAKDA